jgi:hypothetical protein
MNAVQSRQTLFARAQETAAKVLQEQPVNSVVHLAYFDAQGVLPVESPQVDFARWPGYGSGDYNLALRWARDQIALSSRPRRTLILISDLQKVATASSFDGFPPGVAIDLISVGRPLIRNLAITHVESAQSVLRDKTPLTVRAQIRNAGPFAANKIAVRLMLEGPAPLRQQVRTITIPAGSYHEANFEVPIEKPGVYTGRVELSGGDEFPADDSRFLALDARPADRLLLLDGQPGVSVYGNETYYLETALRLRLTDKDAPLTPYQPTRLEWTDSARLPDLSPFRAVIGCNVARLGDNDIGRLRAFVSAGGSLLLFTGDQVRPAGYAALERADLLPASVESTIGPDLFRFAAWDRDHPVFRPLSDPQQGDLRRVAFQLITKVKPLPGAKVLASAQAGDPLIVERRLGEGKILLVATAADRDWGDWPQNRLYVPLVHQLVGYLTDRLPETARVQSAPADRDHPPGVTRDGDRATVRNLDPGESEIERFSLDQFRQTFHLPPADGASEKSSSPATTLVPESQRPDEIWMYLVWTLLLLLILELFLANRTTA